MKFGLQNWIKKSFIAALFLFVADLEGNDEGIFSWEKSPFIKRTCQIEIPGYPHAFNPAIVRWKGRLLLNFRTILDLRNKFASSIGLVWLDDDYRVISEPTFINFREDLDVPCRADDPRFIIWGEKLFLVYSDNTQKKISKGGFRVHIAELIEDEGEWHLKNVQRLDSFEGNDPSKREKNWSPFIYEDELHLVYSLLPHKIFKIQNAGCQTVASTQSDLKWSWGELRGGTPCIRIEEGYLSFFHTSKIMKSPYSFGKEMPHYFMGAYLFSSLPPFEIKKMSERPIVGDTFYNGEYYTPYWKESRVVFPSGILVEDDSIIVSYGREDHECWIVEMDKQGLLDSLTEVTKHHIFLPADRGHKQSVR